MVHETSGLATADAGIGYNDGCVEEIDRLNDE